MKNKYMKLLSILVIFIFSMNIGLECSVSYSNGIPTYDLNFTLGQKVEAAEPWEKVGRLSFSASEYPFINTYSLSSPLFISTDTDYGLQTLNFTDYNYKIVITHASFRKSGCMASDNMGLWINGSLVCRSSDGSYGNCTADFVNKEFILPAYGSLTIGYYSTLVWGSQNDYYAIGVDLYKQSKNNSPTLDITSPAMNSAFSANNTSVTPAIIVSDIENNNVTCKYYIDSETTARDIKTVVNTQTAQLVNFTPINMSSLSEGNHTIKFEIADGITPIVTKISSFRVDKTPPVIGSLTLSSTVNSITASGSATDSITGIDANPYRYSISSKTPTNWTATTTYTQNELLPNINYTVMFESKDKVGNISSTVSNIYTKATVPSMISNNISSYTMDLNSNDNNPTYTQYQISVNNGSKYVTPEGTLTASPVWITLPNKSITVNGLTPETAYTFQAKAKNAEGIETGWSSPVSGTTLVPPPTAPINVAATSTSSSVTVVWDPVTGSTGYDIEVDGNVIDNGIFTSYTHTGLTPYTQHTYKVRAKNAGGLGAWSDAITKYTQQNNPNSPFNIDAAANNTSIIVTWKPIPGATAYDVEVDGVVINNSSSTSYVHSGLIPGTMHSYRVRSINSGGKSEWSNEILVSTQQETPSTPSNVTTFASGDCINVTWNPIQGATYEIEVDGAIRDIGASSTFVHNGLASGSTHVYRVRAKQSGSISEWSTFVTATLPISGFGTPSNIKAEAADTSIALSWDSVVEAVGYEVEVNGMVGNSIIDTNGVFSMLMPNTQYIFRVRAIGIDKVSEWSEYKPVMTYALPTPTNLTTIATGDNISIIWDAVPGAESYDLDIDGQIIQDIATIEYVHTLIDKNVQHTYKVRAKNSTGFSAWSKAVSQIPQSGGTNTPVGIVAFSMTDSINIMWKPMNDATSYYIEIDGAIVQGVTNTSYAHTSLEPGTQHNYRIRAITNGAQGDWSNITTVMTLPVAPPSPTNVTSSSTTSSVLITWDKIENATAYEIEVDGQIIDAGMNTKYLHNNLTPESSHTYRVRAKNISDWSLWSESITANTKNSVQTYDIQTTSGQVFNLVLTANDITDPSKYTYTITYNAEELEVLDLCAATSRIDMAVGGIVGADIQIIQYTPGTIVFKKLGTSAVQAWTGQINSIKFKSKTDNTIQVIYSFE